MLKNILCAILLAASGIAAQATPQAWSFVYTGFHEHTKQTGYEEYEFEKWNPSLTIGGQFAGEDRNQDGFVNLAELSSLEIDFVDYIACSANNNAYGQCGAQAFAYDMADGTLNFRVGMGGRDPEGFVWNEHGVISGERSYDYRERPGTSYEHELIWTAQTSLNLIAPPVPEPAGYAMLGAGLLGLAALQRGRRRWGAARTAPLA